MENKFTYKEIEKNLVHQLSKGNLNKAQLSKISKSLAALHRTGFHIVDWLIFDHNIKFTIENA